MKTKKRNIQVAIDVCIFSLIVYILIHFASEEDLLVIGNRLEGFFGRHSNIQVSTMQSFLSTIISGIFASTLVALCFYIQEYQREKQIILTKVIKINRSICKYYSELPYINYIEDNKFCRLVMDYYLEYYNNEALNELHEASKDYLKKIPKSDRRVLKQEVENTLPMQTYDKINELLTFIKNNPKVLITNSKEVTLTPDQKLKDIILELDYKLFKAVEVYKKILSIDLSDLEDISDEVSVFVSYGMRRRNFLKNIIKDESIYPFLNFKKREILSAQRKSMKNQTSLLNKLIAFVQVNDMNICSTENTVERICKIQERGKSYIKNIFEMHDLEEIKRYDKIQLVEGIRELQTTFFSIDKIEIKDEEGTISRDITFSYNKFIYYIENLNRILLFDLSGRYEFLDASNFAMTADKFERGEHIYTKVFSGEDINPNIYRM